MAERYRLDGPLPPLAIPSTLQDSLMARLDRLAAVKEIAQIGAAIGREFSYPLLHAVVGRDETALKAALAQLEDSELVFRSGEPPDARYVFKHALIQDTAYESLLKSRRQILHRRIAETLREKFPDVAEAEPELVAHHFTQAGLDGARDRILGQGGRSGASPLGLQRSDRASRQGDRDDGQGRDGAAGAAAPNQQLTPLHIAYGNALMAARGSGAPETRQAFARARELASGEKDAPERLAADYGLWVGSYARGELPSMRAHSAAFLSDVEARPDLPEAGVAHRAAGATCWFAGEYREALDHLERALALFQPGRDDDLAFRFGLDPGVAAMVYQAIASWPLGEVDRSVSLIDRMQTRMAGVAHVGTLALGRLNAAFFEMMRCDHPRAASNAFELGRSRASTICPWGARTECFCRVGPRRTAEQSVAGLSTCAAASSSCAD